MTTYSTVNDAQEYGTWTNTVAGISICVTVPLMVLFYAHRDLFPIKQREPLFALVSNLAYQFVLWMYLFERMHPELPLWGNKIYTQLCWGMVVVLYFVRAWKLYIETGLALERVQNKFGWFVAHRHYRARPFLMKLILGLGLIHVILVPIEFELVPQNFIPARVLVNGSAGPILFVLVIIGYFISYGVLACKLRGLRDGFYIKTELGFVGMDFILFLVWLIWEILFLPCAFPSCETAILWSSSVWMFGWSIVFPLVICSRDPRFSLVRCFRFKKMKPRASESRPSSTEPHSSKESSHSHREGESLPERHEDETYHHVSLGDEKLRRVPLATFLTLKEGREEFRKFTVLEWSIENLLFVEEVEALAARQHTTAEVRALWERFVADGAPNQVNLPSLIRERVKARLTEDCTATVFEEAVQYTYKLMSRDTFKRFQRTAAWERCVQSLEPPKKEGDKGSSEPANSSSFMDSSVTPTRNVSPEPDLRKLMPDNPTLEMSSSTSSASAAEPTPANNSANTPAASPAPAQEAAPANSSPNVEAQPNQAEQPVVAFE